MKDGVDHPSSVIVFGFISKKGEKMSPIEIEIVIEIEWPRVIFIDFDSDFDLDYPNCGIAILEI